MANANIIISLVDKATASLKNIENNVKKFETGVNKSNTALSKMESTVKKVGAAIAAGFAGGAVVKTAADFEDLRDSLSALEGSVEAGAKRFEELANFAQSTQFGVEELAISFIKLKSNGVDPMNYGLKSTDDLMKLFSNTAALTTDQIGSLNAMADLFSRTTAGGLGLEDLNRLADRGVPVFRIFKEELGLGRLEITKYGQSAEGARILLEALVRGLEKIPAPDRTDNLSTSMSNFGIAVDRLSDQLIDKFRPALVGIIDGATYVVDAIREFTDNILSSVLAIGGLYLAINKLVRMGLTAAAKATESFSAEMLNGSKRVTGFGGALREARTDSGLLGKAFGKLNTVSNKLLGILGKLGKVARFAGWVGAIIGILDLFIDWEKALKYLELGYYKLKKVGMEALDALGMGNWTKEIEQATKDIQRVNEEIENLGKETKDFTKEVEDNTKELKNNEAQSKDLKDQLDKLENKVEAVKDAYSDWQKALDNEIKSARMSNEEKEKAALLTKGLEAQAKELGKTVEELTETERKNVEQYVDGQYNKLQANREFAQSVADWSNQTESLLRSNYEATTSKVKQLEDEKQKYLANARAANKQDHIDTQNALAEFDRKILEQNKQDYADMLKKKEDFLGDSLENQKDAYEIYSDGVQKLHDALADGIILTEEEKNAYLKDLQDEYIDSTKSEYSSLYGFFEDKLMEFSGMSQKEFGILDDTVKLIFGTRISDTFDQVFAGGIAAVTGFGNQGQQQVQIFGNNATSTMNATGTNIAGAFSQTAFGGIGSFVSSGLSLIGTFATDLFGIFGGLGSWIDDLFGGLFSNIWSGVTGLFGSTSGGSSSGGSGGLFGLVGSLFGPVGGVVGSIVDMFFADGGYIAPGGVGIVGEAGPELVSGPAYVTSAKDTANMFGSGSTNVNITINAVDAKGIDELLSEKRSVITNMVRLSLREDAMTL